jgi:hypothetical protein
MIIQQLNPPIPLVTPSGKGWAHLVIDYGQEHDLFWVCFMDASGECWTWGNRDIRLQPNATFARELKTKKVEK